jgi:hypothetical protein
MERLTPLTRSAPSGMQESQRSIAGFLHVSGRSDGVRTRVRIQQWKWASGWLSLITAKDLGVGSATASVPNNVRDVQHLGCGHDGEAGGRTARYGVAFCTPPGATARRNSPENGTSTGG